jgi:hypothetical protein
MKIEQIYDKISNTYNQELSGDVLTTAKHAAINRVTTERTHLSSILALGVGDASDLVLYKNRYPQAECHGLDISKAMLERAQLQLTCQTYHGDIAHASSMIKKTNFDLITAYFVAAYVPLSSILQQSRQLQEKHGLISFISNTMESFPTVQALLKEMFHAPTYFERLMLPHIKKVLESIHVPDNIAHLESTMIAHGYAIKDIQEEIIPIHLTSKKDVFDFFINGGWFVSGLSHALIPEYMLRKLFMGWINRHAPVPFSDSLRVAVVLGERQA